MSESGPVNPVSGEWHDEQDTPDGVDNCMSKKRFFPNSSIGVRLSVADVSCILSGGRTPKSSRKQSKTQSKRGTVFFKIRVLHFTTCSNSNIILS